MNISFIMILSVLSGVIISYIFLFFLVRRFYIMRSQKGEKIDLTRRINELLLVIDVQCSYLNNTPRKIANRTITNINKVIGHTYELDFKIVYTASVRKKTFLSSLFLFDIAVRGTDGAKIDSRLNTNDPVIFEKFLADSFYNNEFRAYLENNNIKIIFITGMAAEVCVSETIKGALNRGYQVVVIKDTIIPIFGKKSLSKKLNEVEKLGAQIISTDDFLKIKKNIL
jgi:nicotinamidase-related amidase